MNTKRLPPVYKTREGETKRKPPRMFRVKLTLKNPFDRLRSCRMVGEKR